MLSFLQREHSKDHVLLIKIVLLSVLAHVLMLLTLFLGDFFVPKQALVLHAHSGAPVSLGRGKSRGARSPAVSQVVPSVTNAEAPKALTEPVAQPVNKAPQESVSKDVKQTKDTSKKETPAAVKPEKKTEAKKEVPTFSELKKNYTGLKKASAKKEQPVKEPVKEKQAEKEPEKPRLVSVPDKAIEKKHIATQSAKVDEGTKVPNGAIPVASGTASAAPTEHLEFPADGDEAELEGGGSDNILVSEIARHYRRPPGFDDYEPFIFTFEIRNGKATVIGSRGTEPLVLYSALKNAVLKAAFPVSKHTRKIELRIT